MLAPPAAGCGKRRPGSWRHLQSVPILCRLLAATHPSLSISSSSVLPAQHSASACLPMPMNDPLQPGDFDKHPRSLRQPSRGVQRWLEAEGNSWNDVTRSLLRIAFAASLLAYIYLGDHPAAPWVSLISWVKN